MLRKKKPSIDLTAGFKESARLKLVEDKLSNSNGVIIEVQGAVADLSKLWRKAGVRPPEGKPDFFSQSIGHREKQPELLNYQVDFLGTKGNPLAEPQLFFKAKDLIMGKWPEKSEDVYGRSGSSLISRDKEYSALLEELTTHAREKCLTKQEQDQVVDRVVKSRKGPMAWVRNLGCH